LGSAGNLRILCTIPRWFGQVGLFDSKRGGAFGAACQEFLGGALRVDSFGWNTGRAKGSDYRGWNAFRIPNISSLDFAPCQFGKWILLQFLKLCQSLLNSFTEWIFQRGNSICADNSKHQLSF